MEYENMMYEAEVYAQAGNRVEAIAGIVLAWQGERCLPQDAKEQARRIMKLGNVPQCEIENVIRNLERNRRIRCGVFVWLTRILYYIGCQKASCVLRGRVRPLFY